jgi:hypothetical protein
MLISRHIPNGAFLLKKFAKTVPVSLVLVMLVIATVYHTSEKAIAQVPIPYPYTNPYPYPYTNPYPYPYTNPYPYPYTNPYPYPYTTYPYPYPYTDQQYYYDYNYNYYNSPTITSNNAYTDNLGRIHIVGQVTNNSPSIAQYVQVIATLYDINNNIILTHPSVTNPQDILPGQQALFDVIISSTDLSSPQQVNHYSLVVHES